MRFALITVVFNNKEPRGCILWCLTRSQEANSALQQLGSTSIFHGVAETTTNANPKTYRVHILVVENVLYFKINKKLGKLKKAFFLARCDTWIMYQQ